MSNLIDEIEELDKVRQLCAGIPRYGRDILMAELALKLTAKTKKLLEASEKFLDMYTLLVDSGDCGWWNVENEDEVIAMRAAIKDLVG